MTDSENALTIALVEDLIFASRIGAVAKALGVEVDVMRRAARFVEVLPQASLALVDLTVETQTILPAIEQLRADGALPRVIGFCPHVEKELMTAAREAGVTEVVPRSAFVKNLPDYLTTAKAAGNGSDKSHS